MKLGVFRILEFVNEKSCEKLELELLWKASRLMS